MKKLGTTIFAVLVLSASTPIWAENSTDAEAVDCMAREIGTGNYFLVTTLKKQLNLQASSLKVLNACNRQVETFITTCTKEGGSSESCTKETLTASQTLLKDAWGSRRNLKGWLNSYFGAIPETPSSTSEDNYFPITDNTQFTEMVLKSDPVKKTGKVVRLVDRRDYKIPYQFSNKGTVLSSKSEVEFNCKTNESRFLSATFYAENKWSGNVIENISKVDNWQQIPANTVGEILKNYACSQL